MTDWHTVLMHLISAHDNVAVTLIPAHVSGGRAVELRAGTIRVTRSLGGLPDAHDELHSFGAEDHHHDPESAVASWGDL